MSELDAPLSCKRFFNILEYFNILCLDPFYKWYRQQIRCFTKA
ncbi:MAG: hypothetical protein M0T74_02965 [Desulfitobacterium hafniense]|nr:hypothetical protein [Desulfitobacterium hafniense]